MILLSGFRGSKAHGTLVANSDIDTFDIVVMPKEYYLGLRSFESSHNAEDHLVHDIKKFVKLLLKSNPSALELLFTEHTFVHPHIQELLDNKNIFLSKLLVAPVIGHCKSLVNETDGKSRAHCLRLLRMTLECLNYGIFKVKRDKDVELLKAIKEGSCVISNEDIQFYFNLIDASLKFTSLPDKPDSELAEQILIRIIERSI